MESGRGLSTGELGEAFGQAGCPVRGFDSAGEALAYALASKGEDLLFCTGSLYFIGELKECLKEEEHDQF